MTKTKLLFLGILILFLITRLYKITEVPASLYWDEVSIGYNAYSILSDGKDEWGRSWPLHFRAFGEFKLPVYIYSVAVTEWVFGLSALSVRLPAVLYSLGILALTYLVSFKIFKNKTLSLLSAFILSISPWFLIFSRSGYEATSGLMFYLLGIYLFLLSFKKYYFIIFTFISFILSMYSYNSFRVIVPLTIIFLVLLALQQGLLQSRRYFSIAFLSIIIFFILAIPIARLMSSEDGNTRVQAVGIFNGQPNLGQIVEIFSRNYLSHFSPDFLFTKGDGNMRSHAQGSGQLYLLDLPLIFLGLAFLHSYLRKKELIGRAEKPTSKSHFLLAAFPMFAIIVGLIPSAITVEAPHALRSLAVVPFLSMILASGAVFLEQKIKLRFTIYIIVGVYLVLFTLYYGNFMASYNFKSSADWQFSYRDIFQNYTQEFTKFDHVIISDEYAQPYIFALFYLHYNPARFRSEVQYNNVDRRGLSLVASFNNFIFQPVSLDNMPSGRLLVFASPREKITLLAPKDEIKNLDGSVAFYIYEVNR